MSTSPSTARRRIYAASAAVHCSGSHYSATYALHKFLLACGVPMPAELSANTDAATSPAADEPAEPQASANPFSLETVRPRCHISLRLTCCIISYLGAACLCPRNLSANAHAATCPTAEPEQASARSLITATMWSTKWTSSLYSIRRVDASSVALLFKYVRHILFKLYFHIEVAPCEVVRPCRRTCSLRVYSGLMAISG